MKISVTLLSNLKLLGIQKFFSNKNRLIELINVLFLREHIVILDLVINQLQLQILILLNFRLNRNRLLINLPH